MSVIKFLQKKKENLKLKIKKSNIENMRCVLLFTIAILASYCVLESFSYKIKLGPKAQKAPKDALPKVESSNSI